VHLQPDRYLDWVDPAHHGIWDQLVKDMRGWPGTSLISHELFSSATGEQAAQVIRSLSFAEVHVLVTARDLARQIPSVWQENIKNQHTTEFGEFIRSISARDRPHDPFWEFQDLPRILDSWGRELRPEHVHVVTVPPSGSGQETLWRRFVSVLGLAPDRLPHDVPGDNASLSAEQIEVLRRLNRRLQPDRIAWARYELVIKEYLIGRVMFGAGARTAPTLPDTELRWVREAADETIAHIRARGFDVVGDLGELEPRHAGAADRPQASVEEILELTLDTFAEVMLTMPEPISDRTVTDRFKNLLRRQHRRLSAIQRGLR
jgi:hypothetical protein